MSKLKRLMAVSLVLAGACLPAFAQRTAPRDVVAAFYKFERANSQDAFNLRSVEARKRWFSASLYKSFRKELDRTAEFIMKEPTGKPHFGDGLPFQPLDEPCEADGKTFRNQYRIGRASVKADLASVDVTFFYPATCNLPETVYAVQLVREKGRWVIDDLLYSAESRTLGEELNRAEY